MWVGRGGGNSGGVKGKGVGEGGYRKNWSIERMGEFECLLVLTSILMHKSGGRS